MSNLNTTTTALPPYEVENCADNLRVYSDGSISRSADPILPITIPTSPYTESITWKDFLYDPTHNLHLRLYKPTANSHITATGEKLPVIFYIHAGGFCIGSITWPLFHNYCLQLAAEVPAIVASVGYRLAPEHRIPAAMEDCFKAFEWLMVGRDGDVDGWLDGLGDFGRLFVVGDSAGGNLAHNLAVQIGGGAGASRVRGYVLLEPFFGGTVRTKSESEAMEDTFLNLDLNDRFWRLSIPEGDTTDHPMINPFGPRGPNLEELTLSPILVLGGSKDLLKDRSVEYVERLKKMGKNVKYLEFLGEEHGFFMFKPDFPAVKEHMTVVKRFIQENSG